MGARNRHLNPEEDDREGGGAGLRIDAKTKIQKDLERKEIDKKNKEKTTEEKQSKEELALEKKENKDIKEKAEKERRIRFTEKKSQSAFLGFRTPSQSDAPPFITEQEKLAAANQQESKLRDVDFNQVDPQTAGLKVQSVNFKFMEAWLGESANFRTMKRLTNAKPGEKKTPAAQQKDDFTNFVEKTFKPNSPGKKK